MTIAVGIRDSVLAFEEAVVVVHRARPAAISGSVITHSRDRASSESATLLSEAAKPDHGPRQSIGLDSPPPAPRASTALGAVDGGGQSEQALPARAAACARFLTAVFSRLRILVLALSVLALRSSRRCWLTFLRAES